MLRALRKCGRRRPPPRVILGLDPMIGRSGARMKPCGLRRGAVVVGQNGPISDPRVKPENDGEGKESGSGRQPPAGLEHGTAPRLTKPGRVRFTARSA